MLLFDDDQIPVTPDAPTARQWLENELSDTVYQQGEGIVQRIINWVTDFFGDLFKIGNESNPVLLAVVVLFVLAVIVGISMWVAGPVRRRKRMNQSAEVLADEDRTAEELRAAAHDLARAGKWRLAVLDQFRAMVRSLADRVIIDERPGWTADEAARAAAHRFPGLATELSGAGQMFDAAFYGERDVDEAGYNWLRSLDERVQAARPAPTASAAGAPDTASVTGTGGGKR